MSIDSPITKSVLDLPRERYPVKVLQFGSGNFLRGFVDWMIQEANHRNEFNGGVTIVQSISKDTTLQQQDGVFTVVLKGIQQEEFVNKRYKIDVVQRVVNPLLDFDSFLQEATNPELQLIVSNTTEAGIVFSAADLSIDQVASTFPGKLTQLLFERYQNKLDNSLLVLPTELIEKNGTTLKKCVQDYCNHWALPVTFSHWINTRVTFCNTLVDRIVSGFPEKTKDALYLELGYRDELLVEGEWFHQWVIEGPRWIEEILPFRKAGLNVIYTNELAPYRTRKVRILNGAHTCMACVGLLAGLQTVRESIEHPIIGNYLRRLIYDDISVLIAGDLTEIEKYAEEVINRFRNPSIDHQLRAISLNSLSKFSVRVLPSLLAQVDKNGFVSDRLVFALASLIFLYREAANGVLPLKDNEEVLNYMKGLWASATSAKDMEDVAKKVLARQDWWGSDLSLIPTLTERTATFLHTLAERGALETLKKAIG